MYMNAFFLHILQPVILKELQHTDGDFSEDQRIELNTVRCLYVLDTVSSTLLFYLLWVHLNPSFCPL